MLRDLIGGMRALRLGEAGSQANYRDFRQVVRMRCHYEVECRWEGRRVQGTVVDIDLGGMKFRASALPEVGKVVEVSLAESDAEVVHQAVPCRVVWLRRRERDGVGFAGLTYDASNEILGKSWVKVLLKELGFRPERTFQRRRFLRAEGFVPVQVTSGNQVFDGRLGNLGVQGALVEGPLSLVPGTELELRIGPFEDLPALAVAGVVAQLSRQEGQASLGVRFHGLSDQATAILLAYLRQLLLTHWDIY